MKERLDVKSFFTKSASVWTSENFQSLLLAKYGGANSSNDSRVVSSDLQDIGSITDPRSLVFKDADGFLERLALLIGAQIEGGVGELLNDSSANYFFVVGKDGKYYSVLVRWEQAQKLWRCGAYLQEDLKLPNVRIFRPA